ncbi:MAG: hypothetical protein ACLFTZ_02545 [Acholeplasmataceae bacterium]
MWWEQLSLFQQIMFVLAVGSTAIMVLFIVLLLLGIGGDEAIGGDLSELDLDVINDEPLSSLGGLRFITVRGFLAFTSVGGWIAFILADVVSTALAGLFGALAGVVAAYLLQLAFVATMKLESSGNIDYANAIGKPAVVYIRVPKNGTAKGKVVMTLQSRYVEVDAITEDNEDLLTNEQVEVVGTRNRTTLIVKKTTKGEKE